MMRPAARRHDGPDAHLASLLLRPSPSKKSRAGRVDFCSFEAFIYAAPGPRARRRRARARADAAALVLTPPRSC